MRRPSLIIAFLTIAGACLASEAAAQETRPQGCADCHQQADNQDRAGPPQKVLAASVHRDLECADCHESVSLEALDPLSPRPHGDQVEPVDCGGCHDQEAATYLMHGRLAVGQAEDLPTCGDCHGTHDILPSDDRRSRVHPLNMLRTCQSCHLDADLAKKYEFLRVEPVALYESSAHGQASQKGLYTAATCNDCHSAVGQDGTRSAHRILGPADPDSPVFYFNIPDTCGQCHRSIMNDYWEGIHGRRVKQSAVDSPVCTTCHGEHGIASPSDPRSSVSAARLAEATCAPCHESQILNEKYGIPAGRLKSYVDSYHGLKAKAGDVDVANCASCHGSHRVLPHTDPTSSIHPANLQETCGECHLRISAELASTPIHATATGIRRGWPRFFTVLYLWIIAVTIGLMVLHNLADWLRRIKCLTRETFVVRLTVNETVQHWVLMISFTVLVISGFSLRFSEAWWVELLFGWGGGRGFIIRGTIHRVAAVIFMIWAVWHLLYLFTARGRHYFKDMLASKRDLRNIKENVLFFLGTTRAEPRYARFTYMEKCEYWALLWGTVIMTITGILLWFDNYFVHRWHLPKGVLDVVLVIHYYEAWLATLAIFVWHIYHTVFHPAIYPMNPAWIAGRMPKEQYTHKHPDGPVLKGHAYIIRYEDAEEEQPEVAEEAPGEPKAPPPSEGPAG